MFLEEFISVYCTEKLYALLFAIWNYQNPGIAVVLVSHAQMYAQTQWQVLEQEALLRAEPKLANAFKTVYGTH